MIMRKQVIDKQDAETIEQAHDFAPWAAAIREVEGGWKAYESITDYEQDLRQN